MKPQIRLPKLLLVTIACNVVLLLGAIAVQIAFGLDASTLYRDANAVANQPFLVGSLSNVGVVLWIISATAAWGSFALTRSAGQPLRLWPIWGCSPA